MLLVLWQQHAACPGLKYQPGAEHLQECVICRLLGAWPWGKRQLSGEVAWVQWQLQEEALVGQKEMALGEIPEEVLEGRTVG